MDQYGLTVHGSTLADARHAFSVTKESGLKSKIKPPPPPAAVQLDASNFDDIALDESKDVLVAFTAPWVRVSSAFTHLVSQHSPTVLDSLGQVQRQGNERKADTEYSSVVIAKSVAVVSRKPWGQLTLAPEHEACIRIRCPRLRLGTFRRRRSDGRR